ncbi:helix-turn-helix domain-containing protein [Nannocystis punicea]
MCLDALRTTGNIVGAAELLGISRQTLKNRIRKYGIQWPPGRKPDQA